MNTETENLVQMTADVIIETEDGGIVLVKRMNEPYKGRWALPGGKMDRYETIEATAIREAREETGLEIVLTDLLGVYSDPGRDPRGHYVSVAYIARIAAGTLDADSDAEDIMVTRDVQTIQLAFDHNRIIADYMIKRTEIVNLNNPIL